MEKIVLKRDGSKEIFDLNKIKNAINKALKNSNKEDFIDTDEYNKIVKSIEKNLSSIQQLNNNEFIIQIENIQNLIEKTLMKNEFLFDVVKNYIVYRENRKRIREDKDFLKIANVMDGYLGKGDWRVNENSNVNYSLGGLILHNSGAITANYWLNKIYTKEIAQAHKNASFHLHDLSMFSPYCAGWSIKQVIEKGINGIPGKMGSKPAKHLNTICTQLVNFLGIMQNEWAGAQAFSSFDTYLSAFVRADKLNYKQVKQSIQNFIFGVNTPSRWGCVPIDTEVLTCNGWKKYNELNEGDYIYGWKDGQLEINNVNKVVVKEFSGKLIEFYNDINTYSQIVTPDHNVFCTITPSVGKLIKAKDIEKDNLFPLFVNPLNICSLEYGDDKIKDYAKKFILSLNKMENELFSMNNRQIKIFIDECMRINGDLENKTINIDNTNDRLDDLQHLCMLLGITSFIEKDKLILRQNKITTCDKREKDYDGLVWCPSTDLGVVIFRDINKNIFISGQSQSPFSNITLDWVCPNDLKNRNAIVGGEEQDYTYGELQEEMDMINKAFLEIMIEGDANGRGFSYPIPTYNITKDFIWDSENAKMLFEMAGKYGTPYFQNFINSNLNPEDVRSMPLSKDTNILIRYTWDTCNNCEEFYTLTNNVTIEHLYNCLYSEDPLCNNKNIIKKECYFDNRWYEFDVIKNPNQKVYRISFENGLYVDMGEFHLQPLFDNVANKINKTVMVKDILLGDYLPFYDKEITIKDNYDKNISGLKITSIKEIKYDDNLYCLEISKSNSHLFTLGNGIITHNCCRLRLDKRELRNRGGGLFGADEFTGSMGVVTINLPQLAYKVNKQFLEQDSKEKRDFFYKELGKLMDLASESLQIKRKTIIKLADQNLFPYTSVYLKNFDNHFSTIGLCGMNEAMINFLDKDITSEEGRKFSLDILDFMLEKSKDYQEKTGDLYNIEASPSEATSYRFAKHDKINFPDIISSGTDEPYYTNSTQLPVMFTDDVFSALEHQNDLQIKYTGGTVFHTFLGASVSGDIVKKLLKTITNNYEIPYITFSPIFSICPIHGYLEGDQEICPKCKDDERRKLEININKIMSELHRRS